jgi:hypothetical protein
MDIMVASTGDHVKRVPWQLKPATLIKARDETGCKAAKTGTDVFLAVRPYILGRRIFDTTSRLVFARPSACPCLSHRCNAGIVVRPALCGLLSALFAEHGSGWCLNEKIG